MTCTVAWMRFYSTKSHMTWPYFKWKSNSAGKLITLVWWCSYLNGGYFSPGRKVNYKTCKSKDNTSVHGKMNSAWKQYINLPLFCASFLSFDRLTAPHAEVPFLFSTTGIGKDSLYTMKYTQINYCHDRDINVRRCHNRPSQSSLPI